MGMQKVAEDGLQEEIGFMILWDCPLCYGYIDREFNTTRQRIDIMFTQLIEAFSMSSVLNIKPHKKA